jgi:excisionase family DNA binding protein
MESRAVSTRQRKLSKDEIQTAFVTADGHLVPPILAPAQLAELLGLSVKTIYEWLTGGRLDGAYRKRGKHVLIWRDRALDLLFNGPEWKND